MSLRKVKLYYTFCVLLISLNMFSQEIVATRQFKFKDSHINYVEIGRNIKTSMYYNKILLFINDTPQKTKRLERIILRLYQEKKISDRNLYCFVSISDTVLDHEEQELFFLRFAASVLTTRKLIDSKLLVFSEKDLTTKYREQKKVNDSNLILLLEANNRNPKIELKEPFLHLNEINKLYIGKDINEIKKVIVGIDSN